MTTRPDTCDEAGGGDEAGDGTGVFLAERPRLLGIAYRMLGSVTEADDVLQDVWLRWRRTAIEDVDRPAAWLTTVTTRVALDHLRTARRRRESYVGPWLPEPVLTGPGPADSAELAESLRMGFLTLLDRLAPVDRAVLLLADVFGVPFAEIADTVGKSEAACRQIAHRARRRIRLVEGDTDGDDGSSMSTTGSGSGSTSGWGSGSSGAPGLPRVTASDREIVDHLLLAVALGDVDGALRLLAPDVVCLSDGGAAKRAARRPVVTAPRVARLLVNLARRHQESATVEHAEVNGDIGVVLSLSGTVDMVVQFEVDDGLVRTVRMVRNPDKLLHLADAGRLR